VGKVCGPGIYTGLQEDKTQWFSWTLLLPRLEIQFNSVQFNASFKTKKMNTAHETTICLNPPIQFYGRQKILDRSSTDQHVYKLCFYKNMRRKNFVDGHNILTEDVFVTKLSGNAGISVLMNCVFYDKCPFYERCGPHNVSDSARQENNTTADIRYRELNDRDAAIDVCCVSFVKNSVLHRLILPGGHSIPLKIILNNCCTTIRHN
jgi:hypothetical protein